MNKVTAAVLAAAMVGAMAVPAFAEGTQTGNKANNYATSDNTTVKYVVTEEYEWSIHAAIDFGNDKGTNRTLTHEGDGNVTEGTVTQASSNNTNKVSVTKNKIPNATKLVITVTGNSGKTASTEDADGFVIKTTEGATLDYTATSSAITTGNGAVTSGGTMMEVLAGTNTADAYMVFTLTTGTGTAEVAGEYNGCLTYTASIEGRGGNREES